VLELKKPRAKITPLKFGISVILIILFWMGLQFAAHSLMDSVYFKFLLLCFLGFGFMFISYILKYG
jgi:hypothetical protein